MTVGELREALEHLPKDDDIVVKIDTWPINLQPLEYVKRYYHICAVKFEREETDNTTILLTSQFALGGKGLLRFQIELKDVIAI